MPVRKKASYFRMISEYRWIAMSVLMVVGALAYMGHLFHLSDYAEPSRLAALFERISDDPWTPAIIIGLYVGSGLFLFPVSILSLATAMTFEPLMAVSISMTGAMLNAIVYYGVGYMLHLWRLQAVVDRFLPRVKKLLDRGGVTGVVMVHVVPIAPFVVVNLCLGIMSVPFVTYLFGTFLALVPGMVVRSFLGDALRSILEQPDMQSIVYIVVGLIVWLGLIGLTHIATQKWQKLTSAQKKTTRRRKNVTV